ncbi:MAG: tetratricopeptide repeat protein [Rhodospirillales bacterium]
MNRKAEQRLGRVRAALAAGRPRDAWAEARQLLAGRVPGAAVLNLAGIAAFQCGDAGQARDLLLQAARLAPKDADIRMNLGNVLAASGENEAALDAYATACDLAPDNAEPAYNAGILLSRHRRHADAVIWFRRALARDIDHAAAAIGCAEALHQAGDLAAARAELEALVTRRPEDAVALCNLSAVWNATGDDVRARDMALRAIEQDPGFAAAHFNLGVALQGLADYPAAIESYRRALALEPGHAAAALNMGEASHALGKTDDAARAYARALDIDPGFAMAAVNRADLELAAGRPAQALAEIEKFLRHTPGHPAALAFKAFALLDQGKADEARILSDPDRFIARRQLSAPDGYADIKAFNDALGGHVLAHPTLSPSPKAHATRKGRHSGELLSEPLGPMAAFREEIRAAFQAYRRRFIGEASHPFLDGCPDQVTLSVWGVVMDTDGHQVPHIHPAAWLSGVYYVAVPDSIRDDDPSHAGWIEFGRPPTDIHAAHVPDVRLYRPEAGLMLLFPSHFYHRTVPLTGSARRISIAFDVIKCTD